MDCVLLVAMAVGCGTLDCRSQSERAAGAALPASAAPARIEGLVFPSPTNAVRLRLYTNAAPDAQHVFNTFDLEAYGETLLRGPTRGHPTQPRGALPSHSLLHNILIEGQGPDLVSTNGMTVIEHASGPEWRYLATDVSAAYRGRLEQFHRAILYVEPDLLVLYDRLVAKGPFQFQMLLHVPAATRLDANWGELHLDLPKAGITVHSPGRKRDLRPWERFPQAVEGRPADTITMRLGPTNQVAQLHVITAFVVRPGGVKRDCVFKLVESSSAIGAQVHRDGLPTLIAFRTDPAAGKASLDSFPFTGPAGVYVFRPKAR